MIKREITEIALGFMESAEMAEHMRSTGYLRIADVMNLIMTARASLDNKISAIRDTAEKLEKIEGEVDGWDYKSIQEGIAECGSIIKAGEFALK